MLRRNLSLDVSAAVGVGITMALMGTILPSVARRQGLDPLGLAILAASPFLANLLGAFAGRIGPRTQRQFGVMRALGALCLVLMLFMPVPTLLAVVAFGYWLTHAFGVPIQHRLWGAIYPTRERGRLLGVVATGRTAAAGVAALAGGIIADRIGGLGAIAIGGLIGALLALATTRIQTTMPEAGAAYSFRDTWSAYKQVPALRRVAWAQVFYGGGLIAAGPLYALVRSTGCRCRSGRSAPSAWSRRSRPRGPVSSGGTSRTASAASPSSRSAPCWAPCPSSSTRSRRRSCSSGSPPRSWASATPRWRWAGRTCSRTTPRMADRAKVAAGLNALTGARGLIAPFLGTLLVQAGILSVTAALLLCGARHGRGRAAVPGDAAQRRAAAWFVRVDNTAHGGIRRARSLVLSAGLPGIRG